MEVCQQHIRRGEFEPWVNEQIDETRRWLDASTTPHDRSFKSSNRRRTYRHNPTRLAAGAVYRLSGGLIDRKRFRIHYMVFHALGSNWLERSVTNVQGDFRPFDALRGEPLQERRREMQTRGGCSNRAGNSRVHGLVPLPIREFVRSPNIWRKWNMPDPADGVHHIATVLGLQSDRSTSIKPPLQDFASQLWRIAKLGEKPRRTWNEVIAVR